LKGSDPGTAVVGGDCVTPDGDVDGVTGAEVGGVVTGLPSAVSGAVTVALGCVPRKLAMVCSAAGS